MRNLPDLLAVWTAAIWVGGLWAIGYLAAPVLFSSLGDKMLAGRLAGHMFTWIAYVGMVCASWLIMHRFLRAGASAMKQAFFWVVVVMLLLTLAQHFGIQPVIQHIKDQALPQDVMKSLFRDRFETWHGVASVVYLIQSLLGLVLLAKQGSR